MGTRNFVLHIGIGDYRTFAPGGDDDLPGAVDDARRWERWTTGDLAVPAAQVTVLTDGAATRAGILQALRALGAAVGADGSGLVTFSGHGAAATGTGLAGMRVGATAALAPSDVARAGSGVSGLLTLAELEAALGAGAANTTIVVDACYTRLPSAPSAPGADAPLTSRVILGAEPWSTAWEVASGGNWHGAFTFALLTLLEQWSVQETDGASWSNAATGDLLFRARAVLEALGVEQRPMLAGAPRTALIPFLRPGPAIAEGETSPKPDRPRPGSQLSIGNEPNGYRVLQLQGMYSGTWVTLATVIVVGAANPTYGYAASQEHWTKFSTVVSPGATASQYRLTVLHNRTSWNNYKANNNDEATYSLSPSGTACNEIQTFGSPPSPMPPTGYGPLLKPASAGPEDPKALSLWVDTSGGTTVLKGILWVLSPVPSPPQSYAGFLATKSAGYSVTFATGFTVGNGDGIFVQPV